MKLSSMHSIVHIKNRFTLGQKEGGLIRRQHHYRDETVFYCVPGFCRVGVKDNA